MTSKEMVLAVYPDARALYFNCGMGSSYWSIEHQDYEIGRAYCGAMSDARAWDDAASSLPTSPSPLIPKEETGPRVPCGECHLRCGETCDICGAKEPKPVEQPTATKQEVKLPALSVKALTNEGYDCRLAYQERESQLLASLQREAAPTVELTRIRTSLTGDDAHLDRVLKELAEAREENERLRAAIEDHLSDGKHVGPRSQRLRDVVALNPSDSSTERR